MTHLEKLVKSQIAAIYASLVGTQKYSAETTKSHITLWHSDFDESDMCFVIEVEAYCEKKASFSAYLYPHDKNRKAKCLKVLQEVLRWGERALMKRRKTIRSGILCFQNTKKSILMSLWLRSLLCILTRSKTEYITSTKKSKQTY